jgi:hypothetical protein
MTMTRVLGATPPAVAPGVGLVLGAPPACTPGVGVVLVLVLVPASTADAATATIVVIVRSTARRVGDTGAWVMSGKPCSERGEEGQADAQQRNASLAATLAPHFAHGLRWARTHNHF